MTASISALLPAAIFATIIAALSSTHSTSTLAAIAILGGLVGQASLVVHEVSHAFAARAVSGVTPRMIRLTAWGASTHLDGAYLRGRDQARVAAAGPAGSLAFALLLTAVAACPLPPGLRLASLSLALLNVVIAVICSLPFAPLDGHKWIVGVLWWITGSERRAASIIESVGRPLLAVDVSATALLTLHKPSLGSAAAAMLATLLIQKHLIRRHHTRGAAL